MNLALGVKIIWKIISGNRSWWKDALRKKYLNGNKDKCLTVIPINQNTSPIWKLCQNTTFIIQDDLRWSTGNGRKIRIWEDSVGTAQQRDNLMDLMRWMDSQNFSTINEISS